jgi:uncharacterized membrane protein YdfJ with MMPL/SSD domain
MLTTAVLFDTFVVRVILVPLLGGILGELSWWPYTYESFSRGSDTVKEGFS